MFTSLKRAPRESRAACLIPPSGGNVSCRVAPANRVYEMGRVFVQSECGRGREGECERESEMEHTVGEE